MKDLIAKLEAVPEGSRELDLHIRLTACPVAGYPTDPPIEDFTGYDGHEFRFEDTEGRAGVWGNHVVPHYTTSLDAKLPGENIVSTYRVLKRHHAVHHSKGGSIHVGQAHTEALARRSAALKATEPGEKT